MTCERFEDLPVWQTAAELYELTEELLRRLPAGHPKRKEAEEKGLT